MKPCKRRLQFHVYRCRGNAFVAWESTCCGEDGIMVGFGHTDCWGINVIESDPTLKGFSIEN